jgi:hypothetical protein
MMTIGVQRIISRVATSWNTRQNDMHITERQKRLKKTDNWDLRPNHTQKNLLTSAQFSVLTVPGLSVTKILYLNLYGSHPVVFITK